MPINTQTIQAKQNILNTIFPAEFSYFSSSTRASFVQPTILADGTIAFPELSMATTIATTTKKALVSRFNSFLSLFSKENNPTSEQAPLFLDQNKLDIFYLEMVNHGINQIKYRLSQSADMPRTVNQMVNSIMTTTDAAYITMTAFEKDASVKKVLDDSIIPVVVTTIGATPLLALWYVFHQMDLKAYIVEQSNYAKIYNHLVECFNKQRPNDTMQLLGEASSLTRSEYFKKLNELTAKVNETITMKEKMMKSESEYSPGVEMPRL